MADPEITAFRDNFPREGLLTPGVRPELPAEEPAQVLPAGPSGGLTGTLPGAPMAFTPDEPPIAPMGSSGRAPMAPPEAPRTLAEGELPPVKTPLTVAPTKLSEADEVEQLKLEYEDRLRRYHGTVREHTGEFRPIAEKQVYSPETHPEYNKLQQLLSFNYDKAQQKRYAPQIKALHSRILADTKAKNREATKLDDEQRRNDLRQIDGQKDTVSRADGTLALVGGAVDSEIGKYAQRAKSNDLKERELGDYFMKVTPIGTMNEGTPDKPDYTSLKDRVRNVAVLNGMTPGEAAKYTMEIARPMGIDEANKRPQVGLNGRHGKAGTAFTVEGQDRVGHMVLRMADGRFLRIDTNTLQTLDRARLMGYKASQQWHANRENLRLQPSWGERNIQPIVNPIIDSTKKNVVDPATDYIKRQLQ